MRLKILFFIIILCIATSAQQSFEEIYFDGYSPGFTKETIWSSTYLNGMLYVGTSPNGHLYKVNPNKKIIEEDLGSIVDANGTYTSKYIYAITNDGERVYGGTSFSPIIFSYDPTLNKIIAFGNKYLRDKGVSHLFDATVFKSKTGKKYIFYATHNNNNEAMVLKWEVEKSTDYRNLEPEHFLETITFNGKNISNKVEHLEIGYISYNSLDDIPILLIKSGTSLIIYDLELLKEIKRIGNITAKTIFTDPDFKNRVWLFNSKNHSVRCLDILSGKYIYSANPKDWSRTEQKRYASSDKEFIYTYCGRINKKSFVFEPYKSKSKNTNLPLTSIQINPSDNEIFGIYRWATNPIYLFTVSKDNLLGQPIILSENFPQKNPSGGGYIVGLTINNRIMNVSFSQSSIELITNELKGNRQIKNIKGKDGAKYQSGVQADKIISNSEFIVYGIYSGPYLRVKSLRDKSVDKLIPVQNIIGDNKQVRIRSIFISENNELIIGTGASVWETGIEKSKAKILFADLNEFKRTGKLNIKVIGIVDGYSINSLTYNNQGTRLRIYGTVTDVMNFQQIQKIFLYDFDRKKIKTIQSPISIPARFENSRTPSAILCDGGKIFLGDCHNLWIFEDRDIRNNNDFYKKGSMIKSFTRKWCSGGDESSNGIISQLIKGNDDKIYTFSDGSVYWIDPANPKNSKKQLTLQNFNINNLGLEITVLAIDESDRNNTDIYIGTKLGRVFRLTK